MPVEVSIDFIFRLAEKLNIRPEDAFMKYCDLDVILAEPPYGNVYGIVMKKPCAFFNGGCDIHRFKPVTCLSFPSIPYSQGKFIDYPCMKDPPDHKELELCFKLSENYAENGIGLSKRILFKNKQPFIDLREMKDDMIRDYLEECDKTHFDRREFDKATINVIGLLKERFSQQLTKQTIFMRIRMIKEEDRKIIGYINRRYYGLREQFKS